MIPNTDRKPTAGERNTTQDPLTATECTLAAVWMEVLQTTTPPEATDDFFDLGGDSMTMVLTEFRIMEEFSVELTSGAMLTARTLREAAALIEHESGHDTLSDNP